MSEVREHIPMTAAELDAARRLFASLAGDTVADQIADRKVDLVGAIENALGSIQEARSHAEEINEMADEDELEIGCVDDITGALDTAEAALDALLCQVNQL